MKRILKSLKETIGELNEVLLVMGDTLAITKGIAGDFYKTLCFIYMMFYIIQRFKF